MQGPVTGPNDGPGLFRVTELFMMVVFGVVVATAPTTLIEVGFDTVTYLTATVLLLFMEAYLVLNTYHRRLGLPYDLTMFATDLFLVAIFATLVRMLEAAAQPERSLTSALTLAAIVFVLLFVRQLGSYGQVDAAVLSATNTTKAELLTPMLADFAGLAICGAILLADADLGISIGSVQAWAGIAFVTAIIYFVVKYLLVINISIGRRS